ncbi:MAG: hypothetical protein WC269_01440 [Candidatus Gracilibacteria bacterium]|jgi:UDP-2,3-diacylglucosamine pyrophosphatase LpxH
MQTCQHRHTRATHPSCFGEIINQIEVSIKPRGDSIKIIPLSDLHIGAPHFNETKAQKFIDYIKNTKDTYTVIVGDLIENATRYSVGDGVYTQTMSPDAQREYAVQLLKPISKKILCLADGNHSFRTMKDSGLSPEKLIAEKLDVEYIGWGGLLKINLGNLSYLIHITHGSGGGTTIGGMANKLMKQASRVRADIYLRGHHHTKFVFEDQIEEWGVIRKRGYGITGSFLNYKGSYAEQAEFSIPVQGCIKIKLYVNEFDFHLNI